MKPRHLIIVSIVCLNAASLIGQQVASHIEENAFNYWTKLGIDGWNQTCAPYGDAGILFEEFVQFDVHGRLTCGGQSTTYGGAVRELDSYGFCNLGNSHCLPEYTHSTWDSGGEHYWQRTSQGKGYYPANPMYPENGGFCYNATYFERQHSTYMRYSDDPFCPAPPVCTLDPGTCYEGGGWPNWEECACNWSPIIVDLDGDGIRLTSAHEGVDFDLNADSVRERVAWQRALEDDAFLVLDRDGNGVITDGRELFGSVTEQPPSSEPNGFLALAMFDAPNAGGNSNGSIDAGDSIFARLRLWIDTNHDGQSGLTELRTLSQSGVRRIALDYRESRRTDEYGNRFRYKARVVDNIQHTRWVWDVFLATAR